MSKRDELIHDLQELAAAEKVALHCAEDPNKIDNEKKLISLEQDHEVRAWAFSLGCSEQELREGVNVVGRSADEVRRYLSYRKR